MARGRWGAAAFAGAVLALALAGAAQARNPTAKGKQWALLIAGSNGYGNYRHQVRSPPPPPPPPPPPAPAAPTLA